MVFLLTVLLAETPAEVIAVGVPLSTTVRLFILLLGFLRAVDVLYLSIMIIQLQIIGGIS